MDTDVKQNKFESAAKWLIGIGLVFGIISMLWFWTGYGFQTGSDINAEQTSQIVSTISGIITPLWSLASVVLFYIALKVQQADFKSQLEELKATRDEFHITRLTNILYSQLEKVERSILLFTALQERGFKAISDINTRSGFIRSCSSVGETETERSNYGYQVVDSLDRIMDHSNSIRRLISMVTDSLVAFNTTLMKSDLSFDDRNELRDLFRENIGREFIFFLHLVYNSIEANEKFVPPFRFERSENDDFGFITSDIERIFGILNHEK